ncbi:MAG: bifunctional [glutamate--ammonia ligase]-adenylyl-L-tyrosine phosphorylase/[glutamate--ammonia-ligase] adenylyltransferase [Nitrospirae bacterium]|nr:bifunctional [glutamate--ammonia ligase]-adenylyl-L-tyrosine phosphorylase/[glutamate--ammonia-ligase] adenylyltransferase [Nitrospirota bacterium]
MNERDMRELTAGTPDPDRALNNLRSFLEENPSRENELKENIRAIVTLFSHSQFLANYGISYPDDLFAALRSLDSEFGREGYAAALQLAFESVSEPPNRTTLPLYMSAIRRMRLREFLRITLRDILRKADLVDIMLEMSCLADAIIDASLRIVRQYVSGIYGVPETDEFAVIALGKLGAEELNFSSDVDFMYVYGTEIGETSGVVTAQGTRKNRISNHEYFCKVGEELSRFLSHNTEAGFAYRVDLRLRPEGQRGAIALALRGYEMYYESWGRAWERAMLLRARPVAGDAYLGNSFMEMIRPFVFRKYLDFTSIDEISKLKTKIDSAFKKGDIKRGYGGIREIEFFAQALQLIYAGREPLLRERSVLKVLHRLSLKGLIGQDDYGVLSDNYRYLRTLEHRLQQVNDIQTHTLPAGEAELLILGRKMGYASEKQFSVDLERRRDQVRLIYDSLFAEKNQGSSAGSTLFDEEFSDGELKEFLSGTNLREIDKALRNIRAIKDSMFNFQTLRGRRLLSEILPAFVDSALRSGSPDMALNHIQAFAVLLSMNESYLEIFSKNSSLIDLIVYVFSQSRYLSKMLIARPQHLEMIGWQEILKKNSRALKAEINDSRTEGRSISDAVRILKQMEEIRIGLLFLQQRIDVIRTTKALSRTAEAILASATEYVAEGVEEIAVIGFGKLGGREITFGSDLDLIFVAGDAVTLEQTKVGEKLLRLLISYTRDGLAYSVDTRLRPEGSKGPLVSSVEAFKKYYAEAAAFWEFQALLKARPVAGDMKTGCRFMDMARDTLQHKGGRVSAADVRQMRDRIRRELAKESEGYDIKLGPGGIEDIEFAVQFLQLRHCRNNRKLLVQSTIAAIHRLSSSSVISASEAKTLKDGYWSLRTLESLLRLRGESVLKKDDESLKSASGFMGCKDPEDLIVRIGNTRTAIAELAQKYLRDS